MTSILQMNQNEPFWFKLCIFNTMKSITVHNIDQQLVELIEQKAKEWDLSLNKTIKKVLKGALTSANSNVELKDLAGTWSEEEYEQFNKNVELLSKVDLEDWKT